MAKKKEMILEERLEQALVPEEEWPYELPDGWKWIKLIDGFSECLDKFRKPINAKERSQRLGEIPYYGATGQVGWIDDYLLDEDVVLVGEDGAPFFDFDKDKAYLISGKSWVNNHVHIIKSYLGIIGNKYIMYYLNQFNYHGYVNGTTRLKLTQAKLREIKIPLPPIDQIEKLVEQIDTQFEKLDRAKELIQNAIDSFEDRKAAILHKAFTGELTKKWREENGVGLDSWEERTLGSVCKSIFDGDHNAPPKSNSGVPFLVISNVNNGRLSFEDTRFVPAAYFENLKSTRKPQKGDVLYTVVGSYGIPVIVDSEQIFCFQRHIALLKPDAVNTEFLWFLLQSHEMYQKATAIATGTAQLTVPIRKLRELEFNMPTWNEQTEIVNILERLIGEENEALEKYNIIKEIENLKKTILSKVFRGTYIK